MPAPAVIALCCLAAAAAVDARTLRVPNLLVASALACSVIAYPEPSSVAAAALAMAPLLALSSMRVIGMGDAKLAAPIGVLLAGYAGIGAIAWWWAWSLLGAAVTQTVTGLTSRRLELAAVPLPRAADDPRRSESSPLAPALVIAALLAAVS